MNPYEKYYLRQKLVTAAVAVGAVAVVGGGLLLWQPWNRSAPDREGLQQQQQNQKEETPVVEEVKPELTITIGGKSVDCMVYRGDGWTIPYPMDWTVEEGDGQVHFIPPESSTDGTCLTVTVTDRADYTGTFNALGAKTFGEENGYENLYYHGDGRGYAASGKMTESDYELYEKTMRALMLSMTIGEEKPFTAVYPRADIPPWQLVDGEVVLFMDKDGVDLGSAAEQAVKARMSSWSNEKKTYFTGRYRLGTPAWASSYTCVAEDYIDVFCMTVEYEIVPGSADEIILEEGQMIRNGWLIDESTLLYIAVFHDGSVVKNRVSAWGDPEYFGAEFAARELR